MWPHGQAVLMELGAEGGGYVSDCIWQKKARVGVRGLYQIPLRASLSHNGTLHRFIFCPTWCEGQGCLPNPVKPPLKKAHASISNTSRTPRKWVQKFYSIIASSTFVYAPPATSFIYYFYYFFSLFFFCAFASLFCRQSSLCAGSAAFYHSHSQSHLDMRHKNLGFQYICGLLCPSDTTRFIYNNYVRFAVCVCLCVSPCVLCELVKFFRLI